ncbi:MAG: hypothetical protein J5I93_27790 [Pirellulaceae bacterium]|nr:hypothetical protein [Pirellulaceae bacterium]
MDAIGHFWAAAVFSGFATPSDWRSWADRKIEENESPEDWIVLMSLASTEDELLEPLGKRMRAEELECGHRIYIGNAKLGYIYWSFKLGKMPLEQCLAKSGDEADGGTGDLECEVVYAILNRLEERQKSGKPWDDLVKKADELFQPYLKIAKDQWASLGQTAPDDRRG